MMSSTSVRPVTHSNNKSENSLLPNDSVIQSAVKGFLLRVIITLALCFIIGCAINRDPVPLDSSVPLDLDGSAKRDSQDKDRPRSREGRPDSSVVPSPESSLPDGAGSPEASVNDASTRETSTLDSSTREASTLDSSTDDASIADTSVEDTSMEDAAEMDSSPSDDAEEPPNECDLSGIYGGQVTVEAWWGGRSLGELVAIVDPGRAPILLNIMFSVESVESDGTFAGKAKACNIKLPPFYSTLVCESYLPVFPTQAWESEANPLFPVTGNVDCSGPGCTMHFDTLAALLGVSLDEPNDAWPGASDTESLSCAEGTGIDCFLDHDDDDEPGITADILTEGIAPSSTRCSWSQSGEYEYQAVPISFNLSILFNYPVPRTDRIHLGARAMIGGDVIIADDCGGAKGAAIAEGFDSRAIGCYLQPNSPTGVGNGSRADENTRCTEDQRQFMDENLPIYNCMDKGDIPPAELTAIRDRSPSEGPRMSLVKLGEIGDGITCEDVLKANY